jgi:hypothetical protein
VVIAAFLTQVLGNWVDTKVCLGVVPIEIEFEHVCLCNARCGHFGFSFCRGEILYTPGWLKNNLCVGATWA